MRETRADTALSTMFAVGLHLLLLLLLFAGLKWSRPMTPAAAAGAAVDADLVDPNALSASMQRALAAPQPMTPTPPAPQPLEPPPPQPAPTPAPDDALVAPQPVAQEAIPVPDQTDQERVDREALSVDTRAREQEEKHRQEQIDLTQREQQQQAEQKQRLAQQSLDEQIRKIREARRQASHEADLAEQKIKQLANVRPRNAAEAATQPDSQAGASTPPGNNGVDAGLLARYRAAIGDAIQRNWIRPDSVPLGQPCKLQIRQLPGGEVIDVQVLEPCPYDDLGKRSLEAAVLKAQPLPYSGFEPVFSRTLDLKFQPEEH